MDQRKNDQNFRMKLQGLRGEKVQVGQVQVDAVGLSNIRKRRI